MVGGWWKLKSVEFDYARAADVYICHLCGVDEVQQSIGCPLFHTKHFRFHISLQFILCRFFASMRFETICLCIFSFLYSMRSTICVSVEMFLIIWAWFCRLFHVWHITIIHHHFVCLFLFRYCTWTSFNGNLAIWMNIKIVVI